MKLLPASCFFLICVSQANACNMMKLTLIASSTIEPLKVDRTIIAFAVEQTTKTKKNFLLTFIADVFFYILRSFLVSQGIKNFNK